MSGGLESLVIVNRLGLRNEVGEVKIDAVQALLGVSEKELAQVFEMTSDELAEYKVTAKNKGKIFEIASAIESVSETFNGDSDKIKFWFKTPNPNFGGSSPQQLIVNGRSQYVFKFILASKSGY
jgi:hypothetical protein